MSMFVALVEVTPLSSDALGEGIVGGMVRCYTPAFDKDDAMKKIESALYDAEVRVVEVEWCVDNSEVDWENADNETMRSCVKAAWARNGPVLSEFHVWEAGEEE